jgi:predicted metal-binding membrane protein
MRFAFLERMLHHERAVTLSGLAAVVGLSWAYLLTGAGTMQEMGGMSMPMSTWPWTPGHALLMFVMWLVMMMAMMLPSAAPAILLFATVVRRSTGMPSSAPMLFAAGYVAVWAGFSLLALFVQFLLEWTEWLTPMMESSSDTLNALLLLAAGVYQFTPLKRACLRLCRSPLDYLVSHWHSGRSGALRMGAQHGLYCVACCWGLMLLLFIGGLMNLWWIAALALYVLFEKLAPGGERLGQLAGVVLAGAGIVLLIAPLV